jgi:pSer/pThr/pTyr-binding forkhead associated (FHA) protein
MELRLVVRTPGKLQGRSIPINRSPFLIGRDPECQLRPASALVSGRHCVLTTHGARTFVRDLGSTNGTFLNGQRLRGEQELRPADVLRIGPLDFDVTTDSTAPINHPTPLPPGKEAPPRADDKLDLLRSLDQKSSFLLQNPGIESEEVPAGRTAIDIRLPLAKRPSEPDVEVDDEADGEVDEEKPNSTGTLGRIWLAARGALRKCLGRSPQR